jgi:hypothetical protein
MKSIVLIVIILFFLLLESCGVSSNAYLDSRNPNIIWMDKEAIKKKKELPRILSYQDEKYVYCWDNVFTNFSSKTVPLFYQLDKNTLDIIKSSKSDNNEKYNSLNVIWNEKAGWIIFEENKKDKFTEYNYRKISLDSLELYSLLFKIENDKTNTIIDEDFLLNGDTTKLTYFKAEYLSRDDKLVFYVKCFDFMTMSELWSHQYLYPHPVRNKNEISGIDIKINKKGEPHFLIKAYNDKRKEKKKKEDGTIVANYFFNYYVLSESGKVIELKIDTKEKFIRAISFPNQNQSSTIIAAYTYKNNSFNELHSILIKEVNSEDNQIQDVKEIILNTKKLISIDDSTGYQLSQQRDFQDVSGLQIQSIIQADDSTIYILGEENELKQICNMDSRGITTCNYYWQSGNILITKVAASSSESWTKIISKSQYISTSLGNTQTGKYSKLYSHKSLMINNKLHLFFNDNEKNYNSDSEISKIKLWRGNNTSFIHTVLNPDGKYDMIEALKPKDHPRAIDINSIKLIDSNHLFLFDYKTIGILKI